MSENLIQINEPVIPMLPEIELLFGFDFKLTTQERNHHYFKELIDYKKEVRLPWRCKSAAWLEVYLNGYRTSDASLYPLQKTKAFSYTLSVHEDHTVIQFNTAISGTVHAVEDADVPPAFPVDHPGLIALPAYYSPRKDELSAYEKAMDENREKMIEYITQMHEYQKQETVRERAHEEYLLTLKSWQDAGGSDSGNLPVIPGTDQPWSKPINPLLLTPEPVKPSKPVPPEAPFFYDALTLKEPLVSQVVYPLVLTQPLNGWVRTSEDRHHLLYEPVHKADDSFSFCLITDRGQCSQSVCAYIKHQTEPPINLKE